MSRIQLELLAFLAFSSLISPAGGSPLEVLSAPNLLRVETEENIFVEAQNNVQVADISVQIQVMNHPTKSKVLASTLVTLTMANNFQGFGTIKIPAEDFSRDPNKNQYVYLQAQFPNKLLEKVVLVSFQSGYIFIQTDKSIYAPNSNVNYRIFAVSPSMEPKTRALVEVGFKNPEGIYLPSAVITLGSQISSGQYRLGEFDSSGLWTIEAKFRGISQQRFAAEFEVKDYVLPSFEVLLTPSRPFFCVDSEDLTVNIKATYIFDEKVDGSAYVVFGVLNDGDKKSFPGSLQRVPILSGNGEVILTRQHIIQTFPNLRDLVGSSIFVAVSVLTESGGEMVETELSDIKIVTSPYTIQFKKTPRFFKPGMSFDVTVQVLHPDNSPAQGVVVVVDPGNVQVVTEANGLGRLSINTVTGYQTVTVTARTNDPQLPAQRQATASMMAQAYQTKGNNYIHIGVDSAVVELGNQLKVNIFIIRQGSEQRDLTYLILSRGQLVKHGRYKISHQPLFSLILPISKEMLPSFRIVAYYHPNSDEMVADSVWVDVKDSCMGSLNLELVRPALLYEPATMNRVKITGDPGATVGLLAVDKSVSTKVTQQKIWDLVEKYDTGCTAGGGRDSMNVFYDAGLLFETSTVPGTPYRTDFECPISNRRKRATTMINQSTSPKFHNEDKELRRCCLKGTTAILISNSCELLSENLVNGSACVEAFLRCCKEVEGQRAERKKLEHLLTRSKRAQNTGDDDDDDVDMDEIFLRTNFPQSWLWADFRLSACPSNNGNCVSTSHISTHPLPQSLTTWQFTGISLSRTHGICVSDPLEVKVKKTFFIDLRLPYAAVQGEQLEIKAILHNYSPDVMSVYVYLMEEEGVCSVAHRRHSYRQEVQIGAQTSRSVPFIIMPMNVGEISIEVKAAVRNSHLSDGIMKRLQVLSGGTLVKSVKTVTLNPMKNGVGGREVVTINNNINVADVAPNTPQTTLIFLTGNKQMSPSLEDIISGKFTVGMFVEPAGSGEDIMMKMTLPVTATMYLDNTDQWEVVGFERRNQALQQIKIGYQRELAFRKSDGSFAAFSHTPGSTWLTAYVAKVFAMISDFMALEGQNTCDAIKFVILQAQRPSGMFVEVGNLLNSLMMGDVAGTDSDASMTAFCLIAMQETRKTCIMTVNSMLASIDKAVTYLEQRLPTLTNPYAVAMTSYALANENKLNKEILFKFAAQDKSHWPIAKGHFYTLEATGYALLALVKAKALEEAHPVARWLSQQTHLTGSYESTQATIIVYQAVAEYWNSIQDIDYTLDLEISIPNRAKPDRYRIQKENYHATRTSKFEGLNKDVVVTATGTGEATLKMVSIYYTPSKLPNPNDCEMFDMTVQLVPEKISGEKVYRLTIDVMFKNKERDASLTILDVGLPAGFTVNTDDLTALASGPSIIIPRFEMNTLLSERGSLIIYLDKVSHTQPQQISFRLQQVTSVSVSQPVAVSVYEYYNRKPCVKFYHPERDGSLSHLCVNNQCICAEENCSRQKKEKVRSDERLEKACSSTPPTDVGFVYKVTVEGFTESATVDTYTMLISGVMKEGASDVNPEGKRRTFVSQKLCREALDLKTSHTYLIMGSSRDVHRSENLSYQYVFGENTWVEYWPTAAECQQDERRAVCAGLGDLVDQLTTFGCPN